MTTLLLKQYDFKALSAPISVQNLNDCRYELLQLYLKFLTNTSAAACYWLQV